VRDPEALRAAFAYHPPYYHFQESATNYLDYGPQNSRGFRALKVWLSLKQVGAAGYREMNADDIRLSKTMAQAIDRHAELQLMTQDLSIATFRYVPPDLKARLQDAPVERHLDAANTVRPAHAARAAATSCAASPPISRKASSSPSWGRQAPASRRCCTSSAC